MSIKSVVSKINLEGKIAIVSIIIGFYWVIEGFNLGVWGTTSPGPGFFPILAGALTVLFSLIILRKNLKEQTDNKMTKSNLKWLFIVPLIVLIIVFAMNYLGMMVSLAIFLLFWFKRIEKFSWKKTIILTMSIMVVLYFVFAAWLKVPFPKFFGLF